MSYSFKHYDIELTETTIDCTIRIIDNKFFRVYQKSFDKFNVQNLGIGSLNNFYMIGSNCFKSLELNNILTFEVFMGGV